MNLNQELVKQGWCWWYRKYAPGDTVLEELEREAREAKKELWVDPVPIPPWVYRPHGVVNTLPMITPRISWRSMSFFLPLSNHRNRIDRI